MKFKELREKYRSKFPSSLVAAAVKIALDMGGNMTGAHKKIEAMKRGLANDPMVKDALRQANESVSEETVKLVDMDDDSHQTALKLAQKAGVKVVSKKTKTGTELSVSGSNKKIGKFMMSLPESVNEGKYTAYSDLLLMKARIIDKEGPKSDKLPAVDSQIRIVMKRLGIKEENINEEVLIFPAALITVIGQNKLEKLMKKHDAYWTDGTPTGSVKGDKLARISSPKPMKAIKKDINMILRPTGLKMKEENIQEGESLIEGTWDIPDTKTKLQKLMDLVSKPFFGTTEKDVDRYLKIMPFGDDELYDDLGILYFIPGSQKSKKFPKTDLNQVAMDSLNGRWLTAKKKGNGWDITHINFDIDMDETIKRKSGNIRPGRRMKVEL